MPNKRLHLVAQCNDISSRYFALMLRVFPDNLLDSRSINRQDSGALLLFRLYDYYDVDGDTKLSAAFAFTRKCGWMQHDPLIRQTFVYCVSGRFPTVRGITFTEMMGQQPVSSTV